MINKENVNVVVLYRVIQSWRSPVFEKLASNYNLTVLHGPSFTGSKVISNKGNYNYKSKKLITIKARLTSKKGEAFMPLSPFLFFTLIKYNPDIILCEGASNLFNDFIGFIYAKLFRKKFIWWTLGELKDGSKKTFVRKILDPIVSLLEKKSDAIIVYSSIGRNYYLNKGFNGDKIFTAVNVIDTDNKSEIISKINKDEIYNKAHEKIKFRVIFVGAILRSKKVDLLIKAFKKLEVHHSDCFLDIVGDGPEKENLIYLAKLEGVKNITFHGSKCGVQLSELLIQSDLFVLPGLGGLAVSDALVHGLPVIASIGDGCETDLLSYQNGIIDKNLNEDKLFEYLKKLCNNEDELAQMKQQTFIALKNHNIKTYLDEIKNAIDYSLQ